MVEAEKRERVADETEEVPVVGAHTAERERETVTDRYEAEFEKMENLLIFSKIWFADHFLSITLMDWMGGSILPRHNLTTTSPDDTTLYF